LDQFTVALADKMNELSMNEERAQKLQVDETACPEHLLLLSRL
jgi:hypothetical protein